MLPQEVRRQRIHMTGVRGKEDPYRKCIDRERSSERLEEEREAWRAIAKGEKWKGKITNTGARIPANRSR